MLFHDSRNTYYRNPFGAVTGGTEVSLCISAKEPCRISRMTCRLWDGIKETLVDMNAGKDDGTYSCSFTVEDSPEPVWYYFIADLSDGGRIFYGSRPPFTGGHGLLSYSPPPSYQITVYNPGYESPSWFREGPVYHIFVDRFSKSDEFDNRDLIKGHVHKSWDETPFYKPRAGNRKYFPDDFFGGSLYGVIEKLGYISSLGVKSIYLSPIFKARSNHKYDTGDYEKIDPAFGDDEIFRELCTKASDLGIGIILDGVFSHTGDDSIYFNKYGNYDSVGAYQSKNSPYYKWYVFNGHPDDYECWWGVESMPTVDKRNKDFQQFILGKDGIAPLWVQKGSSGWRLDVADELPMVFLRLLRNRVKNENKDAVIIGEVWEDASRKVSYGELRNYTYGDTLDSVMNYPARQAVLDFMMHRITSDEALEELWSLAENYPRRFLLNAMNLLGSHDRTRIRTFMSGAPGTDGMTKTEQSEFIPDEKEAALSVDRVKCAAALIFTLPGVPCIYYGDEAGLEGMADPFNRAPYPWGGENMDLMEYFKTVSNFRNGNKVLSEGNFKYFAPHGDVLCCLREKDGHVIIASVNRNTTESINVPLPANGTFQVLTGPEPDVKNSDGAFSLTLPPLGNSIIHA